MIDSGSPITIFTQDEIRKILKVNVMFARPQSKTAVCGLQQQTTKFTGVHDIRRQGGKKNHQKCENCDHKRRKTIPHRSRLAKPNKLPSGRRHTGRVSTLTLYKTFRNDKTLKS